MHSVTFLPLQTTWYIYVGLNSWINGRMDGWMVVWMYEKKKDLNWFAWLNNSKSERTWLLKCNEIHFFFLNSATVWERKQKKHQKHWTFIFNLELNAKPLIKSVEKKSDNKKQAILISQTKYSSSVYLTFYMWQQIRRSTTKEYKNFCLFCLCVRTIIHYLFEFKYYGAYLREQQQQLTL